MKVRVNWAATLFLIDPSDQDVKICSKDYDALEKQIAGLTNQEMMVVARYFTFYPIS